MWIAVNTHANAEELAQVNIERQGYDCYCPRILTTRRHARKTHKVLRPLFPGYLFVRIDPERDRWQSINSSRGTRTVVSFSDRPSPVPEEFVRGLKALEDKDGLNLPPARERFKEGQKVRCRGGALNDLVGKIISVDEKDRIWALMELLGGKVRVRLTSQEVVVA